jgi:hypothetical protein
MRLSSLESRSGVSAKRKQSPPKLFQSVQMELEMTSGCGCVISTPSS